MKSDQAPVNELTKAVNLLMKNRESLTVKEFEKLQQILADLDSVKTSKEPERRRIKAINVAMRLAEILLDNDVIDRFFNP